MRSSRLLTALTVGALIISGCAKAKPPQAEVVEKSASVVPIAGTTRVRIHLSPDAVRRLDIQTGTVRDALVAARPTVPVTAADGVTVAPPPPTVGRVIPFAAVMYAPTGDAFAYVSAGAQLYERTPITVEYVSGDLAVLSSGPPPGTPVVTVGGPELSGTELGIGE